MSRKAKSQATEKAPRTQIEDLPRSVEELSEEEVLLASGGLVVNAVIPVLMAPILPSIDGAVNGPQPTLSQTCTGGRFLNVPTSDTDETLD